MGEWLCKVSMVDAMYVIWRSGNIVKQNASGGGGGKILCRLTICSIHQLI